MNIWEKGLAGACEGKWTNFRMENRQIGTVGLSIRRQGSCRQYQDMRVSTARAVIQCSREECRADRVIGRGV